MNVSLTPEIEEQVQRRVETGRYTSASEVIGEALRLMDERDRLQELHKTVIRDKIAAGVASLRAGNVTDGETFLANMDAELAELEKHGL
jgi:antitoxin ParD1/3/4